MGLQAATIPTNARLSALGMAANQRARTLRFGCGALRRRAAIAAHPQTSRPETISTTLDSTDGQEAVQALSDSILEALFYGPALSELEALAKDISLQVIDHMKEVVAVKKWALPDEQEKRLPMPWEVE